MKWAGRACVVVLGLSMACASLPEETPTSLASEDPCEALSAFKATAKAPGWIVDEESRCAVWNPHPRPNETIRYQGDCRRCLAHGQGTLQWFTDGKPASKYVGEQKNGKHDGHGTLTWADGNEYSGEWKDDMRHGKGTKTWAKGDTYVGEWERSKRHGQGTYTWPDGAKYVGEWNDDKKHGRGTYTRPDGKVSEGFWWRGKKEGTEGRLRKDEVKAAMVALRPDIDRCAKRHDPSRGRQTDGVLNVRFTILPSGSVADVVKAKGRWNFSKEFEDCAFGVVRAVAFRPTSTKMSITFPFVVKAQ